jgi:hypothetical protein
MSSDTHKQNGSPSNNRSVPGEYTDGYVDEYDELLNEAAVSEDTPPVTNRTRAAARGYRPPYERPSRRPVDEREDSFNALAWLVEGATGFVEELRHNDLGLSEEFWVHAAAARREGLLAARALLDQLLQETQEQQTAERARQTRQARRGGINVDF